MKFSGSLIINKPRQQVVDLYTDTNRLKDYQDGFVSKTLLEGNAGENGAKSEMRYEQGKRKLLLIETVVNNQLPDSFEGHYHHEHMDNTMKVSFEELENDQTRYNYEFEYTRINWVMPRLMAILFPGMYRKQGEKWMRQFKEMVEND